MLNGSKRGTIFFIGRYFEQAMKKMDELLAKTYVPSSSMVKYLSENVYIVIELPFVMKECMILPS